MSLAEDLDGLATKRCDTCEWRASRTSDEQERIDAQIRDFMSADRQRRYGRFTDLYNVCVRHGLVASLDAFRHHCRAHVAK
jgi:hypothetical protein